MCVDASSVSAARRTARRTDVKRKKDPFLGLSWSARRYFFSFFGKDAKK